MYYKQNQLAVKSYSSGLGDVKEDPSHTQPLAGSTFVFKYNTSTGLPTKQLNEAFAEMMKVGTAMFGDRNLFGPQIFEVTGVGFSNSQIRIWMKFYNDLGTLFGFVPGTLSQFVGRFDQILEKHLGKGAANFDSVYLITGTTKKVSGSPAWDVIGPFVPYVAAIAAAYFLIPPVIRELRKKQ
jgi:hypothetical protein